MRTLGEKLRAVLLGVGQKLHCYAAQYLALAWSRIERGYARAPAFNGLTPLEARRRRSDADPDGAGDEGGQPMEAVKAAFWLPGLHPGAAKSKASKLAPKCRKAFFLGFWAL